MTRRQRVISITLPALGALAISIFLVHRFDTVPERYVPGSTVMATWGLSGLLMIAAVGLLIFRRTRWAGELILSCALSIPLLFNTGVRVSASQGWIVWRNNPLLKIAEPRHFLFPQDWAIASARARWICDRNSWHVDQNSRAAPNLVCGIPARVRCTSRSGARRRSGSLSSSRMPKKGRNPLAHARGSALQMPVCRCLPSRDHEGAGPLGKCAIL
jgi:hypothetical protein